MLAHRLVRPRRGMSHGCHTGRATTRGNAGYARGGRSRASALNRAWASFITLTCNDCHRAAPANATGRVCGGDDRELAPDAPQRPCRVRGSQLECRQSQWNPTPGPCQISCPPPGTAVPALGPSAFAGTATASLARLQAGAAPIETVLAGLLNELSVLPDDLTVVLDDYHLADGPAVQPGMVFLAEHLPPQVHLVISTRADPALPMARLRARGQLLEIRAADLRFTADEAGAYLNQVHALDLTAEAVAALESRTEGWAAALQLAALSLRGHADPARFIAEFAGADRFVVDYLAEEVLDRQPDAVRRFMLDTCVLDRLTGSLCDAVTGRTDGRATLAFLERKNLFVVPQDDHRRWYRYHHLFADVLHAHLLAERPDDVAALHRRASEWYERSDDPEPAVRHALAAGDAGRAADLVERAIPGQRRQRREAVIRRWAGELPTEVLTNRPVLAIGFVGAFMASNEFEGIAERLSDIERLVAAPPENLNVVDRSEFSRLAGQVATYRSALALVAGDLQGCAQRAKLALVEADGGDLLTMAAASALIGIAGWTSGDLVTAHSGYSAAADGLARAGHTADVLGCSITLADLEITFGRLSDARGTLERALALARRVDPALGRTRGTADMYVGLSRIAWERGDITAATESEMKIRIATERLQRALGTGNCV